MATNPFFNNFNSDAEQGLLYDLIAETIRQYGHDMYYLPRSGHNKDDTLNEYEYSSYDMAIPCEFYIKSSSSFEGQGQFLEKFGLQIKDQMTLTVSKKSFETLVRPQTGKKRPLEGDLIYIPMIKALFEINYMEKGAIFYQLGSLQCYDLTCELYEVDHDNFNTGLPEIDDVYNNKSDIANDPFDQGDELETSGDDVLDFTESNPFTDLY